MDTGAATSASLLLRLRDPADQTAWETFDSLYRPLIRRSCRRRGLQDADAADVSQEVMARVAKSICSFEYVPERGKFRSWLGVITENGVRTFLGRTTRQHTVAVDDDRQAATETDPVWNAEFSEYVLAVACDRIRGEFGPATWAAFESVWLRDESSAEVARRLGTTVRTVYVNKSRVLKRLEQEVMHLAEDLPFAGPGR